MPIHFGTDGWRAVISDTFTFDNLRMVTQAIADAVASGHWDESATAANTADPHKIVVGFDTRFLSDRFAGEVARVLAANGFTVLAGPLRCAHPGHLLRGAQPERHRRGDDHRLAQCPALQRRQAQSPPTAVRRCPNNAAGWKSTSTTTKSQARGPNLMDYDQAREAEADPALQPPPGLLRPPAHADQLRRHRRQPAALRGRFDVRLGARRDHAPSCRAPAARSPRSAAR